MPTGYTCKIDDDPTMTASRWMREVLIRAFGYMVHLREVDGFFDEERTLEILKKELVGGMEYHQKNFNESKDKLDYYNNLCDAEWVELYDAKIKYIIEENDKEAKQTTAMKRRHDSIRSELSKVISSTDNEGVIRIAKFGLEQLGLVTSEEEPYVMKIIDFESFKKDCVSSAEKSLEYDLKALSKAKGDYEYSINNYIMFNREVKRILGE